MSKVNFKEIQRKQYIIAGYHSAALILFMSFPIILGLKIPVSKMVTGIILVGAVSICLSCFYFIRKLNNASCPSCNKNIFEHLEIAWRQSKTLKHCPYCGAEIEI